MTSDAQPPSATSNDWRVELDVDDPDALHRALARLRERGVARDARRRLPDDAEISVSAERIFAYVRTREQAHEAAGVLTTLAAEHHLTVRTTVAHWHAAEERWAPADEPPRP